MSQRESKVPDIKHGDLLLSQYGSIGVVRDSFFIADHSQIYYEVDWFSISEREWSSLSFSIYFAAFEIVKMKRRVNKLRNKLKVFS